MAMGYYIASLSSTLIITFSAAAVCLGYLALDADSRSAFIPNREAMRMIAEINNICREENPLILPIDPLFPPDGIDPFL